MPAVPPTTTVQVRVRTDIVAALDNLAGAAGVDRADYLKTWFGVIARLKREHAVRAMGAIPESMFMGLPGRPPDADARPAAE